MSQLSCQHSKQWPLHPPYNWFVEENGTATVDASGASVGSHSDVKITAIANNYTKTITVEEVNDLLDKINTCSGCVNDLYGQAYEFLSPRSEARSIVGAFLYAATAYDRAQKVTEEGIELEKIKKVLDQALSDYQESYNEKCLHSVIKYRNADVVKYLIEENHNWLKCNVKGCSPLALAGKDERVLAALAPASNSWTWTIIKLFVAGGLLVIGYIFSKRIPPDTIFGKEKWEKYLGRIEHEPPLPQNINQILTEQCPFNPSKRVCDTHILVLIPKAVGRKPFTLNLLEDLIKKPKTGNKTEYEHYNKDIRNEFGNVPSKGSYWTLITRDVIRHSDGKIVNKTYQQEMELIAQVARESKRPYTMPNTLDVATAFLTHYVETGKKLYCSSLDKPTYTRCMEKVKKEGNKWPIVVGNFKEGLNISSYWDKGTSDICGVGAQLRIPF